MIRKYVVNWYHTYLLHPGMDCTYSTIIQHYYWPQLRDDIRTHINVVKIIGKTRNRTLNMENYPLRKKRPLQGTYYW